MVRFRGAMFRSPPSESFATGLGFLAPVPVSAHGIGVRQVMHGRASAGSDPVFSVV